MGDICGLPGPVSAGHPLGLLPCAVPSTGPLGRTPPTPQAPRGPSHLREESCPHSCGSPVLLPQMMTLGSPEGGGGWEGALLRPKCSCLSRGQLGPGLPERWGGLCGAGGQGEEQAGREAWERSRPITWPETQGPQRRPWFNPEKGALPRSWSHRDRAFPSGDWGGGWAVPSNSPDPGLSPLGEGQVGDPPSRDPNWSRALGCC